MADDDNNLMAMTKDEINEFLRAPRVARLATVRGDGRPHVVPVWYHYDGQEIFVVTDKNSVKARNIAKNPDVSLIVDDAKGKPGDISYFTQTAAVVIEGKAEVRDGVDANAFAGRAWEKYVGESAFNHPVMQYAMSVPKCVIAIRPARISSWDTEKMAAG
jgi:PPOX class probable F420-dependent enzyme